MRLLAAAPPFTAYAGKSLIETTASAAGYGWLVPLFILVSALTGGAVLRVAGRVFLGWGPATGPDPAQARAAEERVDEPRGERDYTPYPAWILHGAAIRWPAATPDKSSTIDVLYGLLSLAGAVGFAALGLFGRPLRESLPRSIRERGRAGMRALRRLHSGHIGDYIAWWTAGASAFGAVCLLALR